MNILILENLFYQKNNKNILIIISKKVIFKELKIFNVIFIFFRVGINN